MKKNFQKKRYGFTLVELMTATAIMVILVMFVTNIAVDMLKAYDKTVSALATNSDARSVLDPLQEDLTSAKMFEDGHVWFETRFEKAVDNVEAVSAPRIMLFAQSRDRIRRKITTGTKPEIVPGDLCAISYQLLHQSPFPETADAPENMVYAVYRSVLNPKDTLKTALPYILGGNGKSQDEADMTPYSFWDSGDQIEDPATDTKSTPKEWIADMQNFLVDGIVDLSLIFWYDDYEDDGKRKIAVVNNPLITGQIRKAYPGYDVRTFERSILAKADYIIFDDNFGGKRSGSLRAVEVSVTVLGPDGKSKLMGLQRQTGAGKIDEDKFKELVLEYGVTFSRSFSLFDSASANTQTGGAKK